ncbi:MAG: ATP-binding protein [Mariprofundaceae bacterium]|nr:ATP-binding protein [Mariprofundaceae bacterium]
MFLKNTSTEAVGDDHPQRLCSFRSIVILIQFMVIVLANSLLDVKLPMTSMFIVMFIYMLFNLSIWYQLKHQNSVSSSKVFMQLSIDVLVLAALFYFSGGSSNPFVSLFLIPLVIVAATLAKPYVWAMAAITLLCYSLLMLVNSSLMQEPSMMHSENMHHTSFNLHVIGMWFSFLLSVGLILFFVVAMAEALRERDRKLAEAREKNLRDQHVISLGTLAAGAAHELGTPLATMAILSTEMQNEYHHDDDLIHQLEIMRSQIQRCKTTLSQMSASTGELRAEDSHNDSIETFLNQCLNRWQESTIDTTVTISMHGTNPAPIIVLDETFNQALVNLLNNASDASTKVSVDAQWTNALLTLEIRDSGMGLSPDVAQSLGTPFFTTKQDGHGLGFYLAQAVISRLGGELLAFNQEKGGACMRIHLPLNNLKVSQT